MSKYAWYFNSKVEIHSEDYLYQSLMIFCTLYSNNYEIETIVDNKRSKTLNQKTFFILEYESRYEKQNIAKERFLFFM